MELGFRVEGVGLGLFSISFLHGLVWLSVWVTYWLGISTQGRAYFTTPDGRRTGRMSNSITPI